MVRFRWSAGARLLLKTKRGALSMVQLCPKTFLKVKDVKHER